jgi:hypothetical protein
MQYHFEDISNLFKTYPINEHFSRFAREAAELVSAITTCGLAVWT